MTPEREQEIRARLARPRWQCADCLLLLAELDAVRQEVMEHKHAREAMREAMVGFRDERDQLAAQLREREAMIHELLRAAYKIQYDWEGTRMGAAIARAEAALAPKESNRTPDGNYIIAIQESNRDRPVLLR